MRSRAKPVSAGSALDGDRHRASAKSKVGTRGAVPCCWASSQQATTNCMYAASGRRRTDPVDRTMLVVVGCRLHHMEPLQPR